MSKGGQGKMQTRFGVQPDYDDKRPFQVDDGFLYLMSNRVVAEEPRSCFIRYGLPAIVATK